MSGAIVKMLATLAWAVAAILGASGARADAPCNAGFRDSTPAERATMTGVLQAAKNALPPAPAGWKIVSGDEIFVVSKVCRDIESRPWNYGFSRHYSQFGDYETRQKAMADAAANVAAAQKLKQPRLDAVMAKMTKLSQQQVALVQKGDMAGAEAINAEMAKLQAEYQKIADEGDSAQQISAAGKIMNRDLKMIISVRVNAVYEMPDSEVAAFPPPSGALSASRRKTTSEDLDQGHALVLFGKWARNAQGRWQPVHRPNVGPTAANAISVNVTADPNRLDSAIQSIDFKSLAATLAK